jgi:hypothetical protein
LQPFIDEGQPVLVLFPSTSYLYLPLGATIVTFIAAVLAYVGWLMLVEGDQIHYASALVKHD